MLAYFIVFHHNGFSPSDLRKAQKNGGKLNLRNLAIPFTHTILGYFTRHSSDFINYKGQALTGPQQVEALAQAQSIGT
jgi:sodium/potassium-transporting ATPase subunit alpha